MTSKPKVAGAPLADMSDGGGHCDVTTQGAVISGHGATLGLPDGFRGEAQAPRPLRNRAVERRRVALLARTLETEVIPRLVLARHGLSDAAYPDFSAGVGPGTGDVTALAGLAMQGDLAGGMALLGELRARGVALERIYLDLLAPTARHLGELWTADRSDFASVTIGLCCLQQLVLENSHAFRPRAQHRGAERRILLAPLPGEQHSFGLLMVGEFFRRQGWEVCSATGATAREVVALTRKQWFGMVGFSLACESRLDSLAALIRDIRRSTRNPHIGVLVGGKAFLDRPELAALVGADATAVDGQQAVLKAETLLALLARED